MGIAAALLLFVVPQPAPARPPAPLVVAGSADVLDRLRGLEESVSRWHPGLRVEWIPFSEGVSFAPLLYGPADFLLSSRRAEARDLDLARRLAVELREHVIALDGLTVVVHPGNPVASLSLEQIETLFSGRIVGWYGFGGSDRPVRLLAPVFSSGEYQALNGLASGGGFRLPASAEILASFADVVSTVSADPRAVGLVSMAVPRANVRAVPLRAMESDEPVLPTADSVETGEYPWGRALWMYTRRSVDEDAERLLTCLLSIEGQAEVAKAGFVSLPADRPFARVPPARERPRVAAAATVSFRPGSNRLDRPARDVLSSVAARSSDAWIAARAGLSEDPARAPELSLARARAVSEFLAERGVRVEGSAGVRAPAGDPGVADVWWIPRP
jgi:phosphate transport system substrate-binding protein